MPLLITGRKFIRDLETSGALALYAPLEGGYEGRYQRRLRASRYTTIRLSARGLGDLSSYLMGVHGVRPPHLGKKNIGKEGAVGNIYYIPPIVSYNLEQLPPKSKGLVLWIVDGQILSSQELQFLASLSQLEPRVKVAIEMGGERYFRWTRLDGVAQAA
jgi:NAD(P)H-quinone oxidoreductase subunit N